MDMKQMMAKPGEKPAAPEEKGSGMKGGSPVAAILLRMKQKGEKPGSDMPAPKDYDAEAGVPEAEPDVEGDLQVASEDLVSAVESKDATAIASAFKAMFDICMASESTAGDEDQV